MNTDGCIALIGAVVEITVKDYRRAIITRHYTLQRECENFFLGEYFQSLTDLNGQAIIDKVRRDVLKEMTENPRLTRTKNMV